MEYLWGTVKEHQLGNLMVCPLGIEMEHQLGNLMVHLWDTEKE